MYIPSFDDVKKVDKSKYKLALMVAQRARQLNEGAIPYVDSEDKNNVTIAMEEIIEGHIVSND